MSFSAPRWCKGLTGSRRGAFPIAVTSVGGPGEHQSSYALSGCRRSGPAGSGDGRPWLQCLRLADLLWQVESSSSMGHVTFYFCLFSLFFFLFEIKFWLTSLRAERNQVKNSHRTNSHKYFRKVVKCQWNIMNTLESDTELGFSQPVLYSDPLKSFTEEGFWPLESILCSVVDF